MTPPWTPGALGRHGVLAIVMVLLALLSCATGAITIPITHLLDLLGSYLHLTNGDAITQVERHVFLAIRLPRVLLGALVGGSLAITGASLQGLFRNPLADPGLIGVSSGAALGVVSMIVFGGAVLPAAVLEHSTYATPAFAFLGGVAVTWIVLLLARRDGRVHVATMLLAGIAINTGCGALIGFATYVSDEAQLRSLTMWSLGSLGGATWTQVFITAPLILPSTWWMVRQARALDLFLLGEREAAHLGVDVPRVQRRMITVSALIVGASVGFTGMIGFVGLIVPHMLRLFGGPSHRWLLPGCVFAGASTLLGADILARTVAAPAEMPIGVVTSLLGAPFFLWLLMRGRAEGGW